MKFVYPDFGLKTKEKEKEPNKEKKQKPRFSDEIAGGLGFGFGIPFRFVNENWFQGSAAAAFKYSENLLSTWPLIDS